MKQMKLAFFLLIITLSPFVLKAQPGDPGGGGVPGVPITGIEILIGAGGALGLKKAWNNRKKKNK